MSTAEFPAPGPNAGINSQMQFKRAIPRELRNSRILCWIIQIIGIRVTASDGENAGAQNVRHRMCDQVGVAMVGDDRGQRVDQAKFPVGTCQK